MHQVGEIKTFTINPAAGSNVYSYVWKFWDGTSGATTGNSVSKVLNIGGHPDTRNLSFTAHPVTKDGQSGSIFYQFSVNNPPSIVPSPVISANDRYFPFSTRLSLSAYDLDQIANPGDLPLKFDWYQGSNYLGNGTLGSTSTVEGHWSGNGQSVAQNYTAQACYYDAYVSSNRTIRCYVQDQAGGVSHVDFDLRGFVRPVPQTGIVADTTNIGFDPSTMPIKRVGVGQTFDFEVDARDVAGEPLSFSWSFAGTNGWSVPETGPGVTSINPDASFRSVFTKDLTGELILTGTEKTAIAVATVISPSSRTDVQVSVTLIKNNPPNSVTFSVKDAANGQEITAPYNVPKGTKILYSAAPVDPDNDLCYVYWTFTQSGGALDAFHPWPNPTNLVGPKVVLDTDTWTTGRQVLPTVTIRDRLFGTLTGVNPPIINLV